MNISSHEEEMPIPISSTYVGGGGGHSQNHSSLFIRHESPPLLHLPPKLLHPSNGLSPPPHLHVPTPLSVAAPLSSKKKTLLVKYRECLKNHAASIGGNATDGCGEFMPCGVEGTLEALKCSACNCHRNFHRKEIEGEELSSCELFHFNGIGRKMMGGQKGVLFSATDRPFRPSPQQMIVPFGSAHTSEFDELEGRGYGGGEGGGGAMARIPPAMMMKKRFRTKFTSEQKEKMLSFAEKADWRLQKQEEGAVQQLCQELGIKRRVLKVWMHNNKHSMVKKSSRSPQLD